MSKQVRENVQTRRKNREGPRRTAGAGGRLATRATCDRRRGRSEDAKRPRGGCPLRAAAPRPGSLHRLCRHRPDLPVR